MNRAKYDAASERRKNVAYRAHGFLCGLYDIGDIPSEYRETVASFMRDYDEATAEMDEALREAA